MDTISANLYIIRKLEAELHSELTYHTFRHTIDVLRFAELLALAEGVSGEELALVQTAAAYHDSGFLVQYNNNEHLGCEIAKKELHNFGYSGSQIKHICDMIMATQLPQSPKDLLGKIICDSDMDYLGTEDFYFQSNELRRELASQNIIYTEREWLELEINFMEEQTYFTDTSKMLRDEKKKIFITELKGKMKKL